MADDKDNQIRTLTEQVGKLQQRLADERHVFDLLKAEHKMRLNQSDHLIAITADLEASQIANRTITTERDSAVARASALEQQLAAQNTSPQETDAPHPE